MVLNIYLITITVYINLNFSIGENIQLLVDRPDGTYCFRLHKERVFYVRYDSHTCIAYTILYSVVYVTVALPHIYLFDIAVNLF